MSEPEPEKPAFALPAPAPAEPSPPAGDPPPFAVPPPPGQPVGPAGAGAQPPPFAVPPPPPGGALGAVPPQFAPPQPTPAYGPPAYGPPAPQVPAAHGVPSPQVPPAYGVPSPQVHLPQQPAVPPAPSVPPAPAAPPPQTPPVVPAAAQGGGLKKAWLWAFVVLVVLVCGVSCYASSGSDTGVGTPAAADQQSVVDGLARATAVHGICYGWRLQSSASTVNVGSNLGVGKAVTDDPAKCAKYVEVQGNVRYYPGSSESEDYATYTIRSTLGDSARLDTAAFDRLGAGTGRLLDDPSTAILIAADALPLLTQEAGLAPAPVPVPSATGSVAPVATGGSDFLRDRWVLLAVAGGLLLVAVGALLMGVRASRSSQAQ